MARKAATGLLLAAGLVAASRADARRMARRRQAAADRGNRHVVIVGAGFGGLQAALDLHGKPGIDLTVIDAHNHHLFQPLLYQVATAALSATDIASPVRSILSANPQTRVIMDTVTGVDLAGRCVKCGDASVRYDTLVIATGSRTSWFGHEEWQKAAHGLKTLEDALALRQTILDVFERASSTRDPAERERLLTFVLIGGGPTGVEMAGSIAELSRDLLTRDYALPQKRARIILVEAADRILSAFPPDLSQHAADELQALGVELRTGTPVTDLRQSEVCFGNDRIKADTVIWTAGTSATPAAEWLGVQPEKGGLIAVGPDLRVPGLADVFVIGDVAAVRGPDGKHLPALAPVAKQQGHYVADVVLAEVNGRRRPPPFRYKDYGMLATIGRRKAVAEFGSLHLSGWLAWVVWAVAHIFFLINFRNRVMVSAQWLFAYFAHQHGGRLIVGHAESRHGELTIEPPSRS